MKMLYVSARDLVNVQTTELWEDVVARFLSIIFARFCFLPRQVFGLVPPPKIGNRQLTPHQPSIALWVFAPASSGENLRGVRPRLFASQYAMNAEREPALPAGPTAADPVLDNVDSAIVGGHLYAEAGKLLIPDVDRLFGRQRDALNASLCQASHTTSLGRSQHSNHIATTEDRKAGGERGLQGVGCAGW